ncbi:hypothetical protein AOL_s00088g35 [Orbilia oligospora ATCC 24927]|uniref:Uncharacterized protein n=2 Tax=Orbilia oligospora TaxID=2813651 RepID=G1XHS2_ARTOA|nr:hypothetical protein AOL_s00088g35 [Orbilia oligospora ATCC 24927]EGX47320.1 hypothetical protein AOL_s00088g35 [Orbilia oligospora ATCC 24927]KAF3270583.1 hypothetical protein TWF970_010786 [Orbilia oligospora]
MGPNTPTNIVKSHKRVDSSTLPDDEMLILIKSQPNPRYTSIKGSNRPLVPGNTSHITTNSSGQLPFSDTRTAVDRLQDDISRKRNPPATVTMWSKIQINKKNHSFVGCEGSSEFGESEILEEYAYTQKSACEFVERLDFSRWTQACGGNNAGSPHA